MPQSLEQLTEKELQRRVRVALADASRRWRATDGSLLTILSVGEWNDGAGPDFLHIALLSDGQAFTGHAEVHKRSSDWFAHRHDESAAYADALLHIVLADNAPARRARYTLVIPPDIVDAAHNDATEKEQAKQRKKNCQKETAEIKEPAETRELLATVRRYAEQRLERKTCEAAEILGRHNLEAAFARLAEEFFRRNLTRRLFPNGIRRGAQDFTAAPEDIAAAYRERIGALLAIENAAAESTAASVADCATQRALTLIETPVVDGLRGTATGREIAVNIAIPLALAKASQTRSFHAARAIAEAYFLLPACGAYRALTKKFPGIPQRYVWQQQGLLEYERETRSAETSAHKKTAATAQRRPKAVVAVAAICNAHSALTLYDQSSLRRA